MLIFQPHHLSYNPSEFLLRLVKPGSKYKLNHQFNNVAGVTISLRNVSLSVLEPGDSGSVDIDVCVILDSTPGEIERDIEVTLDITTDTAG